MKKIKMETATRQILLPARRLFRLDHRRSAMKISAAKNRFFSLTVILFSLLNFACTPRALEKPNNTAAQIPGADDKQANFQNELEKMRTANLQYIFVFRRKDGSIFNGEDKKHLRANLPFNNRVVLADEEKAVIVGTNYKFPPENLEALRGNFNIEDYSAPEPVK